MNYEQALIPEGNPNNPGTKLAVNVAPWITVHETANTDVGANADMHARFVGSGQGGPETVSFHFVVDDHKAIQLLPLDRIGWHAGDGCDEYPDNVGHDDIGCFASIAIETCVNSDGNWTQTKDNLAELIAQLLNQGKQFNWGDNRIKGRLAVNHIAQHNAWSGKDCPHKIRAEGSWPGLQASILKRYGELTGTTQVPPEFTHPLPMPPQDGTDKVVSGTRWMALNRIVHIAADFTIPRAWASEKADQSGPRLKQGQGFTSAFLVKATGGKLWYASHDGHRILASKCVERFEAKY